MWKIAFEMGDEVVRTYNQEHGHIMEIDQTKGYDSTRYKVTSPTNPAGYTWEWEDHLEALPSNVIPMDKYRGSWQVESWGKKNEEEIQWRAPSYPEWFQDFVDSVMQEMRLRDPRPTEQQKSDPMNSYSDFKTKTPELYAAIHDSVLQITKGQIPLGQTWDANYQRALKETAQKMQQFPAVQQLKILNSDLRPQFEREYNQENYNGVAPMQKAPSVFSSWKLGTGEAFQDAAAQELQNYEALARDIMRTLPEAEWPQWVKNQAHKMVWGDPKPADMTPYPNVDDKPGKDTFPEDWNFESKLAAGGPAIPAEYSDEDPLDMENAKQLVQDLDSQWWEKPPDIQRQAIANAFRAALTSPRQNLQWNSIVYQDLAHIGPEISDPDHFEQTIRDKKAKWDTFGQQSIDTVERHSTDPEHIAHMQRQQGMSKYFPGIWKNVRNAAVVGPYIEQLRQAALADVARGGTGQYFRQELLDMNIPGIGPKIAAFVWLLLCPTTSKIATIDVHMMRALGQKDESPASYADYLKFENQLDEQRKSLGYDDVPLGAFQWALWDKTRSPGYHQDHTPLKPLDPTPWHQVDWAPQPYARKTPPAEVSPDQQSLFPEQQAPIVTGARWKVIV